MSSGVDAARDLFLGMLALRQGMIDQGHLLAAFDTWRSSQPRRMGEILVELGFDDGEIAELKKKNVVCP